MKISDLIIKDSEVIANAMDKMSFNSIRMVFVVDDKDRVVATLSDGDIRRYLVDNGDIEDKVICAGNKNFKHAKTIVEAKQLSREYCMVPVLDDEGRIKIVAGADYIITENKLSCPVVIQAGGLGTRLYPYTKILPKPLIPIGDLPIIELIINRFVEFGCNDFYVIVNHKKEMIKSYFAEISKNYSIQFVDEFEPLGTGGGLSLIADKINEPFIFANCDTFLDCDFIDVYEKHKENKNKVSIVCSEMDVQIPYGVVKTDKDKKITAFEEKPRMQFLSNVGIYVVNPEVIDMIPKNTKIHFTTICEELMKTKDVGVYEISEDEWNDMGELDKLKKMSDKMDIKQK